MSGEELKAILEKNTRDDSFGRALIDRVFFQVDWEAAALEISERFSKDQANEH